MDTVRKQIKHYRDQERSLVLDLLRKKPMSKADLRKRIRNLGAIWSDKTLEAALRYWKEQGKIHHIPDDGKWHVREDR